MKKIASFFILLIIGMGCFSHTLAQGFSTEPIEPELSLTEEFFRGEVTEVVSYEESESGRYKQWTQILKVKALSGSVKDQEIEITDVGVEGIDTQRKISKGDQLILGRVKNFDQVTFFIADVYRLPTLGVIVAVFLTLVILLARKRGIMAIVGLVFSVVVLMGYILPQLSRGSNPLLIISSGIVVIAIVSIFIAHGYNKRSRLALVSVLVTLVFAAILASLAVYFAKLTGMGTEESLFLNLGGLNLLNFKGLLLGGILIGTLGVLDDITISQTAIVEELKRANSTLSFKELYLRANSIGREHIASLVNTLVLAYAGAVLPLLLLFSVNNQPTWVILNSEFLAEEIIRTLIGSSALILAVPLSTALAAYYFSKPTSLLPITPSSTESSHHH